MLFPRCVGKSQQRTFVSAPDLAHGQPHRVGDIPERLELQMPERENFNIDFIQRTPCNQRTAAVKIANGCDQVSAINMI